MDSKKGIILKNRNTIIMLFFSILLIILTVYIRFSGANEKSIFKILTMYGLLTFMLIILSWYIKTRNVFNMYIFFMLFSILFYFGQPIALLLGADPKSFNVYSITMYSYSTLNETLLFIIVAYLLIHIGGLISLLCTYKSKNKINIVDYSRKMNIVGKILLAISVLPMLILLANSFKAVHSYGYIGLFISPNTIAINGGIFGVIAGFFVPSLYMLIIANSQVAVKRNIYTSILLVYIGLVFLLGRRGENVINLLGLVLIYNCCIRSISGKRAIKFVVMGIIVLFFISVMSQIRAFLNTEDLNFLMIEKLSDSNALQFIYDILTEFGITLLVPATIIEYVPNSIPYYYGKTLINFFMNLIPNLFWDVNPGLRDGTLESVVTSIISNQSVGGFGGSFLAEIYYNFGWLGCFILPFFGAAISKLSNNLEFKFNEANDKLKVFYSSYLFNIILWFIRGEIMISGKKILYFVLFPVMIIKIVRTEILNKSK